MEGVECRIEGLEFGNNGSGFRVSTFIQYRIKGFGFGIKDEKFRVWDEGSRISVSELGEC